MLFSFLHSSRARAAGMDIIESDTGEESNENQCNDPDENVIRLQVEESFWDQIKNKLDNVHIPDFLINLLEILGFGNVHSLSGVMDTKQSIDGQSVIQQIESFAQNDVPDMIEPKEYPKYFGAVTNPKKFRLAPGHKILIAKMSGAASDIIKGKNKQKFFCQPASKSAATVATETTSSQKYLAECEKLGDLITKRLEDSKIFDSKMAKGVVKKLVLTKDMESATVSCSLCNKDLKLRKANNRWTNIINFTRHCEQIHGKKKNNSSQKNVMDMMKQRETSEDLGSDFECNPDSPVRVEVLVHRSPHDSDDDDFNGKTPGRRKRVNPLLEDDENNNDVIECSSESSSSKKGKGTGD